VTWRTRQSLSPQSDGSLSCVASCELELEESRIERLIQDFEPSFAILQNLRRRAKREMRLRRRGKGVSNTVDF